MTRADALMEKREIHFEDISQDEILQLPATEIEKLILVSEETASRAQRAASS